MIFITGGSGFIGRALIRHLSEAGQKIRVLVRPSKHSPSLPSAVPLEVAVTTFDDARGLRAALVGVDTIYHLASAEWSGARSDLLNTDIQGTLALTQAAQQAGAQRIFYLSHLGADRGAAFPVLKAKAIAEEHIRQSGMDYTILRSGLIFGANDHFTTSLAQLLQALPFLFIVPGDGNTLLQPLWVEDLATCLTWGLDIVDIRNKTLDIGGIEYLTFNQTLDTIMAAVGITRRKVNLRPPYLRGLTVLLAHTLPGLPISVYWLDYLAAHRASALDTLPRVFNLMPSRFSQRLAHLTGQRWRASLFRTVFRRKGREG